MSAGRWTSVHLHHHAGVYSAQADDILVHVVSPLIRDGKSAGLLTGWHFIRYGAGGPHIRLRLRGGPEVQAELLPTLKDRFLQRVSQHPPLGHSVGEIQRFTAGLPCKDITVDEVRVERFVPEEDRFGGPVGFALALKQFEASSEMAIGVLAASNIESRSVRRRLGLALYAVHVGALPRGLGTNAFLRSCAVALLDAEVGWSSKSLWEQDGELAEFLTSRSADELHPKVRALLACLARTNLFDDGDRGALSRLDDDWSEGLAEAAQTFLNDAVSSRLCIGRVGRLSPPMQLRTYVATLMHLAANRLGLSLMDEAAAAYHLSKIDRS